MLPWRQIMFAGMLGPLGPLGPKCFVQQSLAVELNEAQTRFLTRDGVAPSRPFLLQRQEPPIEWILSAWCLEFPWKALLRQTSAGSASEPALLPIAARLTLGPMGDGHVHAFPFDFKNSMRASRPVLHRPYGLQNFTPLPRSYCRNSPRLICRQKPRRKSRPASSRT
jgi:hypothetical protein